MVFPLVGYFNCKWGFIDRLMVVMVFIRILVCLISLICRESELYSELSFRRSIDGLELAIVTRIFSCIITF
jgi:hypothetical protein